MDNSLFNSQGSLRISLVRQVACLFTMGVAFAECVCSGQPTVEARPHDTVPPKSTGVFFTGLELGAYDRGVRLFRELPSYLMRLDYSRSGFSADVQFQDSLDADGNQLSGSLSYSYPVKWMDLSLGIAPVWRHDTKLPDRTDLFVETTFKPIQGIVPSIGYYLNINGQSAQYTELKLAFPYAFNDRFRISSYWKWGFGDIYTPSWTATHSEFGVDTNYKMSKRWDLLAYAGMSIPFEGARSFSGKSAPEGFFGLGLGYRF